MCLFFLGQRGEPSSRVRNAAASPPVEQPSRDVVANRTTNGRGARQRRHRNGAAPMKIAAAAPRTLPRKREGPLKNPPKIDSSPGTARLSSPPSPVCVLVAARVRWAPRVVGVGQRRVIELRPHYRRVLGAYCFPPRTPDDASCSLGSNFL